MNEKQLYASLKRIFNKNELQFLVENTIYKNNKDEYVLYDEYVIRKQYDNTYILEKLMTDVHKHFFTLRNAAIWASLDKTNQIMDADRVQHLDTMLSGATSNMDVHDRLVKNSKNMDYRATYLIKLQEDRVKKAQIVEELDSFARKVKRWQEKRFKQMSK